MPTPAISIRFSSKLQAGLRSTAVLDKVGIKQVFVEWMDFPLGCTFPGSSYGIVMMWASRALTPSGSGIDAPEQ